MIIFALQGEVEGGARLRSCTFLFLQTSPAYYQVLTL